MSGIYIHVPFCREKCTYCNFFSVTTLSRKALWLETLLKEIEVRRQFFEVENNVAHPIDTLYFGGGTPSLLPTGELETILRTIKTHFNLTTNVEITLEANPDDVTAEKTDQWSELGINRLSLGLQSFNDEALTYLSRRHSAARALEALETALASGINNITADLIYGVPGLSADQWRSNIRILTRSKVNHISAYSLTVEQKTTLDFQIRKRGIPPPDDEQAALHYQILTDETTASGFEHYEISNFARPGYRSRHNSAYWSGKPYLGLGPSAHSFNGTQRFWNPSGLQKWIEAMNIDPPQLEAETLTPVQRYNEMLITQLRTSDGISEKMLAQTASPKLIEHFKTEVQQHINQGDIEVVGSCYRIPSHKLFTSDAIVINLMYAD